VVTSSLALRKVAGGYQRYSCRLFYEKVRSWGLMKNIFSCSLNDKRKLRNIPMLEAL
jgi:hypothetical protein